MKQQVQGRINVSDNDVCRLKRLDCQSLRSYDRDGQPCPAEHACIDCAISNGTHGFCTKTSHIISLLTGAVLVGDACGRRAELGIDYVLFSVRIGSQQADINVLSECFNAQSNSVEQLPITCQRPVHVEN